MKTRPRTSSYLAVLRLPETFPVMADPLAGLIVASASGVDIFRIPWLLASSALIYSGAAAAGYFFAEGRRAPGSGPPAAGASPAGALSLGAVLVTAGMVAATGAGTSAFIASFALAMALVAHGALIGKAPLLAAATAALGRALNLVLGMSAGGGAAYGAYLLLPAVTFAMVLSMTLLAGRAHAREPRMGVLSGWLSACLAVQYLLLGGYFIVEGLVFAVLFHAVSGIAVISAYSGRALSPAAFMLAVPLLDASFSSGVSGLVAGLPVAALALPALALSRGR